jgi:hypothetical protein
MTAERRLPIAIAVLAIAALTLVVWASIDDGDDGGSSSESSVATGAEQVDAGELAGRGDEVGHPIYWIGPRPASTLELTVEAGGNTMLRYLPEGVDVGDERTEFLTVGTYPGGDATAAVKRAAGDSGAPLRRAPGGGVAFLNPDGRRSAYVAFPGSSDQIEVYDPVPGRALELVLGGEVRPAG